MQGYQGTMSQRHTHCQECLITIMASTLTQHQIPRPHQPGDNVRIFKFYVLYYILKYLTGPRILMIMILLDADSSLVSDDIC